MLYGAKAERLRARGRDGSRHHAGVCPLQHPLGKSGVYWAKVELWDRPIERDRQTEAQGQTTERPQKDRNKKEVALQALPALGSTFL